MILTALRDRVLEVDDSTGFGPTHIVRKALLSGEIDIYPENTGNGAVFFDTADAMDMYAVRARPARRASAPSGMRLHSSSPPASSGAAPVRTRRTQYFSSRTAGDWYRPPPVRQRGTPNW